MRTIYYVDCRGMTAARETAELKKHREIYEAVFNIATDPVIVVPADRTEICVLPPEPKG